MRSLLIKKLLFTTLMFVMSSNGMSQSSKTYLNTDECEDPNLAGVLVGTTLTLCNGEIAQGTLDLTKHIADIENGVEIYGATGTYTGNSRVYPDAADVLRGEPYGPTGSDYTGEYWPSIVCKDGTGYANGTLEGTLYDDADPNGRDLVTEFQYNNVYTTWHTGAGRTNCNEDNFTNVSALAGSIPDDTLRIAAAAPLAWTHTFKDELSNIYFTNVLANEGPGNTWSEAIDICEGLNGGSAGSGWRLPEQKEILQLIVDGIAHVANFGSPNQTFWTSTTLSSFTVHAWQVWLSSYYSLAADKVSAPVALFCVK